MQNKLMWSLLGVAVLAAGCGSSPSTASTSGAATTPAHKQAADVSPAGDIPDNQAYVLYRAPGMGFGVKVPEGWSRAQAGKAIIFTDKLNAIRLETGPAPTHAGRASTVNRTAGSAQRVVYTARSAPDPVTGKTRLDAVEQYTFSKNGRSAVLTLSGPKGADNVDPWRIVTDSFRWSR